MSTVGIARVGNIDLRAQAEIRSALRTDTPRSMGPPQIGGIAMRAEVGRTEAC
jgi:hypothetical protein